MIDRQLALTLDAERITAAVIRKAQNFARPCALGWTLADIGNQRPLLATIINRKDDGNEEAQTG